MDDKLRGFLEKFAELERRTRKLAAEDRALRDEVRDLRGRLSSAESLAESLRDEVEQEREARRLARERVDDLLARLRSIKDGADPGPSEAGAGEALEGADGER